MHRFLVACLALAALTVAGCSRGRASTHDTDPPDTDVVLTGCAAEPTPQACRTCCLETHPVVASEAVVIALLGGCACVQGGAPCREACQDEAEADCRSDVRSEDCDACLVGVLDEGTELCLEVALTLCAEALPGTCAAVATCVDACE